MRILNKISSVIVMAAPVLGLSQIPYFDWADGFQTSKSWGHDIAVDSNDFVYSTGYFHGAFGDLIFNTVSGNDTLVATDQTAIIHKSDIDGNVQWVKGLIGGINIGHAIAVDGENNVYLTGYYSGSVDFDPSETDYILNSSVGYQIYVLKLDANGDFQWVKTMDGLSWSTVRMANSLTIDPEGNILLTGEFDGTVDFDPGIGSSSKTSAGSTDVFVLKLDSDGNLVWVQTLEGTSLDNSFSIRSDVDSNIYLTGRFHGTVDFDPGVSSVFRSDISTFGDIFTLKLNKDGEFLWVNNFGGDESDFGEDIAIDLNGNVYTVGRFNSSVDFDPGLGSAIIIAAGGQNSFVQKVDSLGNFVWIRTLESGDEVGVSDYNLGRGIALDSKANLIFCGYFYGAIDLNPGIAVQSDTSEGQADMFFVKMDSSGAFIWGTAIGGTQTNVAEDIVVDSEDNMLLTGFFDSATDFDPSLGTYELENTVSRSMFVAKYEEGYAGIVAKEFNPYILIYPNPAADVISVEVGFDIDHVEVYNLMGEQMRIENECFCNKQQLDLSSFASGIYQVRIFGTTEVLTTNFLKI